LLFLNYLSNTGFSFGVERSQRKDSNAISREIVKLFIEENIVSFCFVTRSGKWAQKDLLKVWSLLKIVRINQMNFFILAEEFNYNEINYFHVKT